MVGRAVPTTIDRSGVRARRSRCPQHCRQQYALAATDSYSPKQNAKWPEAQWRWLSDAEIVGAGVSWRAPKNDFQLAISPSTKAFRVSSSVIVAIEDPDYNQQSLFCFTDESACLWPK